MELKELQPLYEQRQLIHDLIIRMHRSGLSPPEEQLLSVMEAKEATQDQNDQ